MSNEKTAFPPHFLSTVSRRGAQSLCGQDGEPPRASILSVYASKSSLPGDCHVANACPARSIATSPLWLKTVTCGLFLRHFVPPRRAHNDSGVKSVRLVCYPCSGVIVSIVWDFSAVSHRRRGTVTVRASIWGIRVRLFLFLQQGISRLTPLNNKSVRNLLSLPPRGKVGCRSIAKARRMRGKRRYVFIRFYSPHSPARVRIRSTVSHRGRAGWRVFVSDISLPGDCHVAATFRLVA